MSETREWMHVFIAFIVLSIVIVFAQILAGEFQAFGWAILYSFLILLVSIGAKKATAFSLDASVSHELWFWSRFGLKPGSHLKRPVPLGVIIPLLLSAISAGMLKCMTFLTYETAAKKHRAARRFGYYSFTEMTDFHNSIVGAAGIAAVLALAFVTYWIPGLGGLPSLAVYYAFWNLIPFSKLDGTQILFGSRLIYTALAVITLIALAASFVIV